MISKESIRKIYQSTYPAFIMFLISSITMNLVGKVAVKIYLESIETISSHPVSENITTQFFSLYGLHINMIAHVICLLYLLPMLNKTLKEAVKYHNYSSSIYLVAITIVGFLGLNLMLTAILNISGMGRSISFQNLATMVAGGSVPVRFLAVVIIGPLVEEICFRGIVLNRLLAWSKPSAAVIIQSISFGAVHGNLVQFLFSICLGVALGSMFVKFRKLWVCIVGHVVFNLLGFVFSILISMQADISVLLMLILGVIFSSLGSFALLKLPGAVM